MKSLTTLFAFVAIYASIAFSTFAAFLLATTPTFAQKVELYPNVHTIGVNIDWTLPVDLEGDDTVEVQYRSEIEASWHKAFPVSRVRGRTCVRTCIFHTTPDTKYEVSVVVKPSPPTGQTFSTTDTVRTRTFITKYTPTRTYYVAPDADALQFDSLHPGDLLTAMILAKPGEEVVLLDGNYEIGDLEITATVGPSVLRAAKGHHPTISGGDHSVHAWTETNTQGLYVTVLSAKNANVNCVITADGRRLYPYAKLEDLKTHSLSCILGTPQECGLPGLWRDPRPSTVIPFQLQNPEYQKLYVKFPDNSHPLDAALVISHKNRGLTLRNAKNIRIEGIRFKYYGVSPYGCALSIENSSEIVIDSCKFEYSDRHVAIEGASHHVTILNSSFIDGADWDTYIGKATYEPITPALCYGLIVPSLYPNNDRMMETGGIIFGWNYSGRGTIIRGCTFKGMMDGLKGVAPAVVDSLTAETDIYDGEISGSDDAIELDGNAANVRMWNMRVRDGSISMAPSLSGPLYVYRNILTDFNMSHATIEGYDTLVAFRGSPFKFATGDATPAGSVHVMHNTYVARGDGEGAGFELRVPAKHSSVTFLNNIIIAGSGMAWAFITPSVQLLEAPLELISDCNTYFTTSDVFGARRGSNPTMWFNNLSELQSALPYEAHSILHRVQFTDEVRSDFRPVLASPVIDAGVIIPGLNNDNYYGDGPDIGAVESKWLVDVRDAAIGNEVKVYPNPTSDQITVSGYVVSGVLNWSVTDLTGRIVLGGLSQDSGSSLSIRTSSLAVGVYTLTILQSTSTQSVRVVKL